MLDNVSHFKIVEYTKLVRIHTKNQFKYSFAEKKSISQSIA